MNIFKTIAVISVMVPCLMACGQNDANVNAAQVSGTAQAAEAAETGGAAKTAAAETSDTAKTSATAGTSGTAKTAAAAETGGTAKTAAASETSDTAKTAASAETSGTAKTAAAGTSDTAGASAGDWIANPWRDITENEAGKIYPGTFHVPAGAENVSWTVLDAEADASGMPGALVQLSFDLDGNNFTAREQRTGSKDVDQSGMYYEWTNREESVLQNGNGGGIPCILYRFIGEDETADLCTWYDEESGVSYSLSVVAEDLDGFDLRAVAESIIAPDVPPIEEQRRILEENRSHWTFDEEDYTPDWYYAFTDLDHNGLLEVLAASTQGSGMFTYVHFYEVLPDGSGVRNLCQADEETDGPDAWPEIVLDSIPCYYDSSSDRYYYVCTDVFRDGAAHSISTTTALSLKDGVAELEYLASMEIEMTDEGEQKTYTDGKANPITEEEYNKAVENRFGGMEKSELKPEWNAIEASEDLG